MKTKRTESNSIQLLYALQCKNTRLSTKMAHIPAVELFRMFLSHHVKSVSDGCIDTD